MTLTLSCIDTHRPQDTIRLAPALEGLGYLRLWTTEHRAPHQSSSPIVLASTLLPLTARIRIGTAGVKLRYRNPLQVAEEARLLSTLYPDRFDLGIIGGREDAATHALLTDAALDGDAYERRINELASFLEGDDRAKWLLQSDIPPSFWVCSAGMNSAIAAASCGASFAYSVYLAKKTRGLDTSIVQAYNDSRRNDAGEAKAVIVCFGACATTAEAARYRWSPF